jgi:hypothetical protein
MSSLARKGSGVSAKCMWIKKLYKRPSMLRNVRKNLLKGCSMCRLLRKIKLIPFGEVKSATG